MRIAQLILSANMPGLEVSLVSHTLDYIAAILGILYTQDWDETPL